MKWILILSLIIKHMQLNLDEQLNIASLMGNYKKIHQEITSVENQLNELIDLQHSLSDTLEQTRNEEKLFGEYLNTI